MKKVLLIAICIASLTSTVVFAQEGSQKEMVLKLLEITNTRNMIDQLMKSMEGMMDQQFQAVAGDLPPEGREALETVRKESMSGCRRIYPGIR